MAKKTFVTLDGITSNGNVSIAGTLSVTGNTAIDGNTLFVNATGNNVGVNTQPTSIYALDVSGTLRANTFIGDGSSLTGINTDGGDANTVGGILPGQFLRSDTTDIHSSGTLIINSSGLRINDNIPLGFGTGSDVELSCNGTVLSVGGTTRFTANVAVDGRLGINDITPSYELDVNGTIRATGDIIAFSDERYKENIETLNGNKVYEMRGVSFTRKESGELHSGVIAQELEKIAPELVYTSEDDIKAVAYGNLVGYLIEAVKDLKKEIEDLKNGNA